jgi:hypothetical protein
MNSHVRLYFLNDICSLRVGVRFHLFELIKIHMGRREFCNSCIIILDREDALPNCDVESWDFAVLTRPRLKYFTWKKNIVSTRYDGRYEA